jgi:pilus assembly protein TadC
VPLLSGLLLGLAVLVLLSRPDDGRLRQALPTSSRSATTAGGRVPAPVAACLVAAAAAALLLAQPYGLLVGAGLALGGPRLLARLEPQAVRDERARLLADLPLVLDLLASCLAGGAPLPEAAVAVAAAVPGPAGGRLSAVAAALSVGSAPGQAWTALAGGLADDPLAPAARALSRAADGGAPVAAAVSRLAAEARADARSRGEQAARRVGVLAVAPLGLCFLPAFVLLGVVPVVAGLAGPLLASF